MIACNNRTSSLSTTAAVAIRAVSMDIPMQAVVQVFSAGIDIAGAVTFRCGTFRRLNPKANGTHAALLILATAD